MIQSLTLHSLSFLFSISSLNCTSLSFQSSFPNGWAHELAELDDTTLQAELLTTFGEQELENKAKISRTCKEEENEQQEAQLQILLWEQELEKHLADKPFFVNQLQKNLLENDEQKQLDDNKKLQEKNLQSLIYEKLVALLPKKHFALAASTQLLGNEVWEKSREASEISFDKVGHKKIPPELRRAQLGCKDLRPASFRALCPTSFEENNFPAETFSNTSLGQDTFTERSLTTSSFTSSSLTESSLTERSLAENSFSENTFLKNSFSEDNLKAQTFKPAASKTATWKRRASTKQLRSQQLRGQKLPEANFEESSFDGRNFAEKTFSDSSFENSSFTQRSFEESSFAKSRFRTSSLRGSNFEEKSFNKPSFAENRLEESSFRQHSFEESSFDQSSLEESSLNTGSFEQSSYRTNSFEHRSFEARGFSESSFRDDSFATELAELARRPLRPERPALHLELPELDETALKKAALSLELSMAHLQLCLRSSTLFLGGPKLSTVWPQGGVVKGELLPAYQLDSDQLELVWIHPGSSFLPAPSRKDACP